MIVQRLASLLSSVLLSLFFFVPQAEPLRFEVASHFAPVSGRLFVVISRTQSPEPRTMIDEAGPGAVPVLARDVRDLGTGTTASRDRSAEIFPIRNLDYLQPGDYYTQALLHSNADLKSLDAPGTEYSEVQRVHLDPSHGTTVRLDLTKIVPPERLPPDDEYIKYVRVG